MTVMEQNVAYNNVSHITMVFGSDQGLNALFIVCSAIPPTCCIRHRGYMSFLYPITLSGKWDAASTNLIVYDMPQPRILSFGVDSFN